MHLGQTKLIRLLAVGSLAVISAAATAAGQNVPDQLANPVRLAEGYFRLPDGSTYWPLGGIHGNMIDPAAIGMTPEQIEPFRERMWNRYIDLCDATPEMLDAWFQYLHDRGVTALRLFPRVGVGRGGVMDVVGRLNPEMRDSLHRVFAAAEPYGIRFQLMVIPEPGRTGYSSDHGYIQRLWTPEQLDAATPEQRRFLVERRFARGREYFLDPDVLTCQRAYLAELCAWLRTEPQVFAVEIYNEQAWWSRRRIEGRGDYVFTFPIEDEEIRWTAEIVAELKRQMPRMPVCLSHPGFGVAAYEPLKWHAGAGTDFYSTHMYDGLCGDGLGVDFAAVTGATANILAAGAVNFQGEWGILNHDSPADLRRRNHRDAIWLSLLAGAPGFLQWEHLFLEEYRWPQRVLAALPKGFAASRDDLPAVEIGAAYRAFHTHSRYPSYTDDPQPPAFVFIREKVADENLQRIYAAYARSLDLGVPIRFTMDAPEAMSLEAFLAAEPERFARPIEAVGGYQLAYMKDANGPTWVGYLRSRRVEDRLAVPVENSLTLKLALPAGRYVVQLANLENGTVQRHEVDGAAEIAVAERTSDGFVLLIAPVGAAVELSAAE